VTEGVGVFCISRWCAWAPGVQDLSAWHAWIGGTRFDTPDQQPDVSFLPALLRRRLDRAGRMALHVAWRCAEGHTGLPLVFASRHGSLSRTMELLECLARNEPLSPAAFSLSVHNSSAGLFSIARADRSPATALAAGPRTLMAALLEGAGMLTDGAVAVLVVYADETPPPEYRVYVETDTPVFALGLLLTAPDGNQPLCQLSPGRGIAMRQCPEVAIMRFLMEDVPVARLDAGEPGWQLERVSAHT
jgi:Beta-ketoacyl synthase, N-terminal domain